MTFVVKAIDAGRVIISHKVIEDSARDKMIEELKGGASVEAVIMQVKPWGAKLFCRGVLMLLRNKDFSSDFTKVSAVKKKGDLMIVKLAEVSQSKRIFVQPLEKFSTPVQINFDIFKVGQIILGEVAAVPAFGAFVNIAPGIDVLCPIPQSGREPAVGDKVKIRILQVRKEEHRIRGKIVGFLEKAEDEEAAKPEEKPEKDGEVK
jgi:small subunit ribosomal protein S1